MDAEVLYADPLFVVAATKNPWSQRRSVRLVDLIDELWALPPTDTAFGLESANIFRAAGLNFPTATIVCENAVARLALVAKGRFLTITAKTWIADREMAIKALPVSLPKTHRPVAIITLKNRTLTPVAQLFTSCAREVSRSVAKKHISP